MFEKLRTIVILLLILALFYMLGIGLSDIEESIKDTNNLINKHIEEEDNIIRYLKYRDEKIHKDLTEYVLQRADHKNIQEAREIVTCALDTEYPLLILTIFYPESGFDPKAKSFTGAVGLGQISTIHVKDLIKAGIIKKKSDLYKISCNVKATEIILKDKLKLSNQNILLALDYYRGGKSDKYRNMVMTDYHYLNKLVNNYN